MVRIGDFARLGGVSVRMLRHYDQIGLLRPARVDPHTGHRSYQTRQLAVLNRVVALKGLGFTLDQVADLLGDGVDHEELHGMLRLRRSELERQVHHDLHILDRVAARLRLIEGENVMSDTIQVKRSTDQRLAALCDTAPDASRASLGPRVERLFTRVAELMDSAGGDRTTPVAGYAPVGDGPEVRITAGYVTPDGLSPGLECHKLAAAEVATVIHQGPMSDISGCYQALARWAEANGRAVSVGAGRWRELYLEADGTDQTEWVVEVQLELA